MEKIREEEAVKVSTEGNDATGVGTTSSGSRQGQ